MTIKKHLPLALLVASATMAATSATVIVNSVNSHRSVEALLAKTEAELAAPAGSEEKKDSVPAPTTEVASAAKDPFKELIQNKHLFGSDNHGLSVKAILGESVLIGDKWIKLGEEVDGIKLVSLESNKAIVSLRGEEVDLAVWNTLPGTEGGSPVSRLIGWNSSPDKDSKRGKKGSSYRREYMVSMNEPSDGGSDDRMKAAREARESYKRKREESRRERSSDN